MNFIIDAQLPPSLTSLFIKHGYDCIHTIDLPQKNHTPDKLIRKLSLEQNRIVITKDTDFFHSFILRKEPYKVVFVTVGNMRLGELKKLFEFHFLKIIAAIESHGMIEVSKNGVIIIH
jgi:predicted nuclease of predicted toxin-antitoxin system